MSSTGSREQHRSAFTIIELLVVVAIIALLIGILLPAIGKARDQARLTISLTNLRNIATAHASYAADWDDRQLTLVDDNISRYGNDPGTAMNNYYIEHGGSEWAHQHPGPILGWGYLFGVPSNAYVRFGYWTHEGADEGPGPLNAANCSLNIPINFPSWYMAGFGSFRLINVQQFNQYVNMRFYDKIFYAPKDSIVWNTVTGEGYSGLNCFEDPGEYCDRPVIPGIGEIPAWSSYILSPAAMFAPSTMANPNQGGWTNPWIPPGGHRSPSMGQSRYPSLKTHTIEHHWLQARRAECNPAFTQGTYGGCEPFYFNQAWESNPAGLFYDGHVETIGVRKAERADGRMIAQSGHGLWSRDTSFGADGYYIDASYDYANTSFHVLTTDGILGRDLTSD